MSEPQPPPQPPPETSEGPPESPREARRRQWFLVATKRIEGYRYELYRHTVTGRYVLRTRDMRTGRFVRDIYYRIGVAGSGVVHRKYFGKSVITVLPQTIWHLKDEKERKALELLIEEISEQVGGYDISEWWFDPNIGFLDPVDARLLEMTDDEIFKLICEFEIEHQDLGGRGRG